MLDPLQAILKIGASGLEAQSRRMRVVRRTWPTPSRPARRRAPIPTRARSSASRASSTRRRAPIWSRSRASSVTARRIRVEHNPGHPAADANGYVKLPNVNMLVEMADMREANRSYEANLQVIKQAREMISMTIDC